MIGVILELMEKHKPPSKDIFEDFLEWINPSIAPEKPEAPEILNGNLAEWIKDVMGRAGIDKIPEKNPLDKIVKDGEANPYQRWPGDKHEPYTKMLEAQYPA